MNEFFCFFIPLVCFAFVFLLDAWITCEKIKILQRRCEHLERETESMGYLIENMRASMTQTEPVVIDGLNDVPEENIETDPTIEICIDGFPITLNDFRIDGVTIKD